MRLFFFVSPPVYGKTAGKFSKKIHAPLSVAKPEGNGNGCRKLIDCRDGKFDNGSTKRNKGLKDNTNNFNIFNLAILGYTNAFKKRVKCETG